MSGVTCETVTNVDGQEWSEEALLLAALVLNSGGRMRITQAQIARVEGLVMHPGEDGDIVLYASGKE